MSEMTADKLREYRELLELWAKWWNGPGRRSYAFGTSGEILPPIIRTDDVLACTICAGCLPAGDTCAACGRMEPSLTAFNII